MSYILEAIKKADQKRKLGSVPDVHTIHEMPPMAARRLFWPYIVAVGLFVNVVLITWWLHPWEAPVVEKTVTTAVPLKKPAAVSGVLPSPVARKAIKRKSVAAASHPVNNRPGGKTVSPSPLKAAVVKGAVVRTVQRRPEKSSLPEPKAVISAGRSETAKITDAGPLKNPAPVPRKPGAAGAGKAASQPTVPFLAFKSQATHPAAMERIGGTPLPAFGQDDHLIEQQRRKKAAALAEIPFLRQLPAEVRARIPEIHISYHAYFFDAARRMVSIDGKIFREGNIIDGDLKLVWITPSGVVLQYKNWQFRVNV
ncbi:general secretion pathway protein GspB [Desulfobacterota bacterium M19]